MQQAQLEWRALARSFWLGHGAVNDASDKVKAKKMHRLKAKKWLCATSHMLEAACGVSWSHWSVGADETARSPAATWKVITLSIDQGAWGEAWLSVGQRSSGSGPVSPPGCPLQSACRPSEQIRARIDPGVCIYRSRFVHLRKSCMCVS